MKGPLHPVIDPLNTYTTSPHKNRHIVDAHIFSTLFKKKSGTFSMLEHDVENDFFQCIKSQLILASLQFIFHYRFLLRLMADFF